MKRITEYTIVTGRTDDTSKINSLIKQGWQPHKKPTFFRSENGWYYYSQAMIKSKQLNTTK